MVEVNFFTAIAYTIGFGLVNKYLPMTTASIQKAKSIIDAPRQPIFFERN